MSRLVVPDASIIVKWALPSGAEPAAEHALALLGQWQAGTVELVAPSLWRYEVASVLARKAPARAAGLVKGLLDLELPTIDPDDELVGEAVAMAVRLHEVTVYDASYHTLALHLGGTFVTADEVYFRRARRLGAIELLAA